jgi:hypothetical protein
MALSWYSSSCQNGHRCKDTGRDVDGTFNWFYEHPELSGNTRNPSGAELLSHVPAASVGSGLTAASDRMVDAGRG